jgi:hypothetical protein
VNKKSLAYREVMEAGATAPFGFFDPIGLRFVGGMWWEGGGGGRERGQGKNL